MKNYIKVIRKNEQKTSIWSGGTTTQLYIYPEDSVYDKRNFKWRISSAKVEVDESIFTNLPNIDRKIMIIEGKMVLKHEGKYTKELNKQDIDTFSGNWITKSYGKAVDFNLMTNKDCIGELEYIEMNRENIKKIELKSNSIKYTNIADALYCIKGKAEINIGHNIELNEGDLFLIIRDINDDKQSLIINNKTQNSIQIARSIIQF